MTRRYRRNDKMLPPLRRSLDPFLPFGFEHGDVVRQRDARRQHFAHGPASRELIGEPPDERRIALTHEREHGHRLGNEDWRYLRNASSLASLSRPFDPPTHHDVILDVIAVDTKDLSRVRLGRPPHGEQRRQRQDGFRAP